MSVCPPSERGTGHVTGAHAAVSPEHAPWPVPPNFSRSWRWLAHPSIVSEARRFTERCLVEWGVDKNVISNAYLITSELVTNSVEASNNSMSVTLVLIAEPSSVLIMCFDEAHGMPVMRNTNGDTTNGRGMSIVVALSVTVAAVRFEDRRKVVYARISRLFGLI
jgi:anti-sigma regulatory factor (Ser/Thr protein kinase)